MIPPALLVDSLHGDVIAPSFLKESDHPWLRALLDEAARMEGRRAHELKARLLHEPLARPAPERKRQLAARVLFALLKGERVSAVSPVEARARLFAAASSLPRDEALREAARGLSVSVEDLEASLFADLPGQRVLERLPPGLEPSALALRANLAVAQGLLARASRVRVEVVGNAHAVVRHARLRGLLCTVSASTTAADGAVLELSGPMSLFRRTTLYGRALATLPPTLSWCDRYRLEADLHWRSRPLVFELSTGAPILPAAEQRRFDSKVEERFFKDLTKASLDWDVVREPKPVVAGRALVFPDFALRHRRDAGRVWLVEIVGFWTRDYLQRKLASYRAAALDRLILCIDVELQCDEGETPPGARLVRFKRRIDVDKLLELL